MYPNYTFQLYTLKNDSPKTSKIPTTFHKSRLHFQKSKLKPLNSQKNIQQPNDLHTTKHLKQKNQSVSKNT